MEVYTYTFLKTSSFHYPCIKIVPNDKFAYWQNVEYNLINMTKWYLINTKQN